MSYLLHSHLLFLSNGSSCPPAPTRWFGQQWDWPGANHQRWWFSDQVAAALTAPATRAIAGPAPTEANAARRQVYPTSIDKELSFDYPAGAAKTRQVRPVDLLGKTVLLPPAVAVKPGLNHVSLDVALAGPGSYVLRVVVNR